jgi:hypothetical protein
MSLFPTLDNFKFFIDIFTVVLSIAGGSVGISKLIRYKRYRDLQRFWRMNDGDTVLLVCSELDNPIGRQMVEDREFIYSMKYGDVDARIEILFSLIRIYPNINLRILSSGEAQNAKVDLTCHVILIGGPDYNKLTERILTFGRTRFGYRSPYCGVLPKTCPTEIVLHDSVTDKEYCFSNLDDDYRYVEQIRNPFDETKWVTIFGGCHTVGVSGASKLLSAFSEGRTEILPVVKNTARRLRSSVRRDQEYSLLCHVNKIGSTVNTPTAADVTLFRGRDPKGIQL